MKKVNRADILARLIARFKLSNAEPELFSVGERITPITNADDLARIPKQAYVGSIATTSTGWKDGITVPANKRYHVIAITCNRTTGSSAQVSQFGIKYSRPTGSFSTGVVTTYVGTASNNFDSMLLYQPIIMDAGDIIQVYCSTSEAASDFSMGALIYEEDA